MYAPTRDQAREYFFSTWRKYRTGETLGGLEQVALTVMLLHPEYHALLTDADRNRDRDFSPDRGEINPFLHLSLHLAIEEQLSIDQPPGIRAHYQQFLGRLRDEHAAKHVLLECLGETLWQAERNAAAPDAQLYLDCLRRQSAH